MKIRITLTNNDKFLLDLETNKLKDPTEFDTEMEFNPNRLLKTEEGYTVGIKHVMYYGENNG